MPGPVTGTDGGRRIPEPEQSWRVTIQDLRDSGRAASGWGPSSAYNLKIEETDSSLSGSRLSESPSQHRVSREEVETRSGRH